MAAAKGVGSVFIWVNVRLRNKSSVCLQLSAKVDTGADALVISNKQCADLKLVCVGEGAYHDIGLTFKVYEGAEIEYMGRSAEIVVHGVVDLEKPLLGMSAICALQVSIDIVGQNLILLTPYLSVELLQETGGGFFSCEHISGIQTLSSNFGRYRSYHIDYE
ncbi:unnamed protein product [Didymodactylos carnosus]|uniref:Peptidase A2 domain-containing protein n=1 Tax=Didymodactylos carnosus TaxID=1234261 RepID=A0A816BWW7_9BILA|nr:unnamed protein product [Didymodactylos carnosus]CAF4502485.1 unnamed protein product [Didymodactylos carnosus]